MIGSPTCQSDFKLKVGIAIEQSRRAVIHALMMYDFLALYPINPKALARYREAFRASGAKDDPLDAELLLDLLRCTKAGCGPGSPHGGNAPAAVACEYQRKLVNNRIRHTNRITSLLTAPLPQSGLN